MSGLQQDGQQNRDLSQVRTQGKEIPRDICFLHFLGGVWFLYNHVRRWCACQVNWLPDVVILPVHYPPPPPLQLLSADVQKQ